MYVLNLHFYHIPYLFKLKRLRTNYDIRINNIKKFTSISFLSKLGLNGRRLMTVHLYFCGIQSTPVYLSLLRGILNHALNNRNKKIYVGWIDANQHSWRCQEEDKERASTERWRTPREGVFL